MSLENYAAEQCLCGGGWQYRESQDCMGGSTFMLVLFTCAVILGPIQFSPFSLSGNSSHSLENLCSSKKKATFSNSAFMLLLKQRMLK